MRRPTTHHVPPDLPRVLRLTVAYDGTAYHGFQRQTNLLTIQGSLETVLAKICGHPVTLYGAGRTDAGVHAYGQVVHFYTSAGIPVERLAGAASNLLPPDIVVTDAVETGPEFHARFSAQSKVYVYRIYQGQMKNPFLSPLTWHVRQPLADAPIQEALAMLLGTHDFSSFRAAGGPPCTPIRTILQAESRRLEDDILEFSFWGDGFLYHMVRNLVGTLVNVGKGRTTPARFKQILESCDRTQAGPTAPPQGLYLKKVFYGDEAQIDHIK